MFPMPIQTKMDNSFHARNFLIIYRYYGNLFLTGSAEHETQSRSKSKGWGTTRPDYGVIIERLLIEYYGRV